MAVLSPARWLLVIMVFLVASSPTSASAFLGGLPICISGSVTGLGPTPLSHDLILLIISVKTLFQDKIPLSTCQDLNVSSFLKYFFFRDYNAITSFPPLPFPLPQHSSIIPPLLSFKFMASFSLIVAIHVHIYKSMSIYINLNIQTQPVQSA